MFLATTWYYLSLWQSVHLFLSKVRNYWLQSIEASLYRVVTEVGEKKMCEEKYLLYLFLHEIFPGEAKPLSNSQIILPYIWYLHYNQDVQ